MDALPRDKDLKGWLRRKGGRMNTWSRRWFVLTDTFLFMFMRDDDTRKSQDCIVLDGQIIVEPTADPSDPKRFYFDIVSDPEKPTDTVSLCADSEDEKKIWVRALKRILYSKKGGALFSQSLDEILFWEKKEGRRIPYIVDECVEYLYKYGLDVEGIFRLPGRLSVIKDVIARFEQGKKIKFEEEGTDVHVVASVLKTFLRDLPDSIIPCTLFQKFMNIALRFMDGKNAEAKDATVVELAEAMKLIPRDNYVILKYICKFLQAVGQHEPTNKMSMMSLGTVFGYNIIRHIDKENSQLFLCTADLGQNLVFMLLNYYSQVFIVEYNDNGDVESNVPTADLLRMSRIIDVPAAIPVPPSTLGHVAELEGIDLNFGSRTSSSKGSDSSIRITDNYYSPVEPSRPDFEDSTNSDDCVFIRSHEETKMKRSQEPKLNRRAMHLSLNEPTEMKRSYSSPASPNSGNPPIPPRRTKSRITRNRNVSDRRRPEALLNPADNSPKSPRSPVTPESVNSEDVLAALERANVIPPKSSSPSPASSLSRHSSSGVDNGTAPPETVLEAHSSTEPTGTMTEADGKVGSSPDELRIQVKTLKEELVRQKEKYNTQVIVLKEQLTEMRSKYDRRIETMQKEFESQKQELQKKLDVEAKTRREAVITTIRLQEVIHKYQMQYGELPS